MMDDSIHSFEIIDERSNDSSVVSGFVDCADSVVQNGEHCSSEDNEHSNLVELDISPKEMCEKLNDFLKQNSILKEKLKIGNSVMQEQLELVKLWQDKILQLKQQHQESLQKVTEENQKLKQENEKLQREISSLQEGASSSCSQCNSLKETVKNLEKDIKVSSFAAKTKLSTELLKQRAVVEELKRSMENICCEVNSLRSNNELLESEKRELTALNNDISVQLSKINSQEDSKASFLSDDESDYAIIVPLENRFQKQADESCAWTDTLLQLHELQGKHTVLVHSLAEEKLKSTSLEKLLSEKKEQVEILKQVLESGERQEKQNIQLRAELDAVQKKLLTAEGQLEGYQNSCKVHSEELESYKEKVQALQAHDMIIVEGLQTEIKHLQESLEKAAAEHQADRKYITELEQELQNLREVKAKMEEMLSDFRVLNERMVCEREILNQQHQEELDNVTAKLLDAEQNLQAERDKVSNGHDKHSSSFSSNIGVSSSEGKNQSEPTKNQKSAKTKKEGFRCPHCYMTFCTTLEEFANHVENECDLHYV